MITAIVFVNADVARIPEVAEEIAAQAMNEVVICDRSVIDNYAYLVTRVGRRPSLDALVDDASGRLGRMP